MRAAAVLPVRIGRCFIQLPRPIHFAVFVSAALRQFSSRFFPPPPPVPSSQISLFTTASWALPPFFQNPKRRTPRPLSTGIESFFDRWQNVPADRALCPPRSYRSPAPANLPQLAVFRTRSPLPEAVTRASTGLLLASAAVVNGGRFTWLANLIHKPSPLISPQSYRKAHASQRRQCCLS